MPQPAPNLEQLTPGLDSPAVDAGTVTPSNDADLATYARALYIGVGGDLKVTTLRGTTLEFRNLPSGSVLSVSVKKVFSSGQTGTIASAIVALY